jgi:type IV secretion system protein VirB5
MSAKELISPPQRYKPEGYPTNPYDRAKAEWDDRIGSSVAQAYNWRKIAFCAIGLCFILSGGLIYQSTKSQVIPYIVEVDGSGATQVAGAANDSKHVPQEKEVKYFLSQFIQKTRSLPMDPVVYRQNLDSSYVCMEQEASKKFNTLMKQENAAEKIGRQTIQVNIKVVIPISDKNFQVRWTETIYENGSLKESNNMTGLFMLSFGQPKDEKEIMQNPLGIFIKDLSWSKEI